MIGGWRGLSDSGFSTRNHIFFLSCSYRAGLFARSFLQVEAGYDCDADALRSALMAAYRGYFHAARAVLYRDRVREKSHYCIGVYLESYRERGLLEDEWVLQFDHIRGVRHNDQYSLDARPTVQEVWQSVAEA